MQRVGEDLFVTNTKILKEGIRKGVANSIRTAIQAKKGILVIDPALHWTAKLIPEKYELAKKGRYSRPQTVAQLRRD